MALADYLREDAVCLDVRAQTRDEVIRYLLERLVAAGSMPEGRLEGAFKAILDRELLGSTAIGRGVAVPHGRVPDLDGVLVAFGYSAEGIAFNALDGEPVHEVFLIIAPPGLAEDYLAVMQRITRLMQDGDFRRFVSRVKEPGEVLDLIKEMDL